MKRTLSLALVMVAVAAGVSGYFYVQSRGAAPQFRLGRVERGPLTAAVSATGNLNAVITVQVGSQISGQVQALYADFNSVVRKGQLIARIDPATIDAKVNQARAEVDSAQATVLNQQAQVERARADVENARATLAEAKAQTARAQVSVLDSRRDLERKTQLAQRELIARSDLDTAQAAHDSAAAQLDAARAKEQSGAAAIGSAQAQLRVAQAQLTATQAQVKQKQAALRQNQVDLEHTFIRAPVDGVVVSRAVDVGQTVAASLQAPVLFTIAQDLTQMQVETSVDEADIGRIRLDGPVTFTVDAFPNETFNGRVVQIRKAAQVVQNVVTYTVVVAVANPEGRLLPGMTANVKLIVAEKPSVLKVANAALRFRPPGEAEAPRPGGGARAGGGPSGSGAGQAGGGGGGGQSIEEIRERLVKALTLTPEQQTKLDPILQASRQQMIELRGQGLPEQDRQARAQRIREGTRAKIREILTPEQQTRYDQMGGGERRAGGGGTAGRIFIVGPDGKPKAVPVTLGISDGAATEILGGDLREGQDVILSTLGGSGLRPPAAPGGGGAGPRIRL
jgi:HlyD family secretion protein